MAIMEGKGRGESTEARSKCGIVHLLLTFSTGGKKARQWEFAPDVYACKSETFIFEIAKRDKTRERERERERERGEGRYLAYMPQLSPFPEEFLFNDD
jgi:hypothetical protein